MPELPEVETVRRGLDPFLTGAKIISVQLNRKNLRFPFPEAFSERLVGRTIIQLSRRAKYLLFSFSSNETILSHLGMSGSWRIEGEFLSKEHSSISKLVEHDHCIINIRAKDDKIYRLTYNDVRRFGFMLLTDTTKLYEHPFLRRLGVEPMNNTLSGAYLKKAFANKKTSLKTALLDQSIVAGLGNIYVCEALWRSHLSPQRNAFTLALEDVHTLESTNFLAQNICNVITEAIASGGLLYVIICMQIVHLDIFNTIFRFMDVKEKNV
ncbi:formamidopyrimidine-DNA glycosylase [Bartonella sp. A1379B]|nr:formamidopyrimidine-DNA glycosylase [Bartonella sp. A1379B]